MSPDMSCAKNECSEIGEGQAIHTSALDSWVSLVPEYLSGRCRVIPLISAQDILDFYGFSSYMDWRLEHHLRCGWGGFLDHTWRAFLVQTPRNQSVVVMTWLGYRGCRWHVAEHFSMGTKKTTRTHKIIVDNLVIRYQDAWDQSGLQNEDSGSS